MNTSKCVSPGQAMGLPWQANHTDWSCSPDSEGQDQPLTICWKRFSMLSSLWSLKKNRPPILSQQKIYTPNLYSFLLVSCFNTGHRETRRQYVVQLDILWSRKTPVEIMSLWWKWAHQEPCGIKSHCAQCRGTDWASLLELMSRRGGDTEWEWVIFTRTCHVANVGL